MLHLILFLFFGAICIAGAVNLLAQRHPIDSALSLVVVMASLAAEYLLLGAEFVAAVQVIVYAGAIMVLFVFVIMLLNAGVEERTKGSRVAIMLGIPGVVMGGVLVAWVLLHKANVGAVEIGAQFGNTSELMQKAFGDPRTIAQLLFHDFLLPFEITSVLIMIAILGAVVLASRPEAVAKRTSSETTKAVPELVPAGKER